MNNALLKLGSTIRPLLEMVLTTLIILKLFGLISISWWLVLIPFWIGVGLAIVFAVLIIVERKLRHRR